MGKVPFHAGLLAAQMRQRRCRGAWKHATVIIQENMRTRNTRNTRNMRNTRIPKIQEIQENTRKYFMRNHVRSKLKEHYEYVFNNLRLTQPP